MKPVIPDNPDHAAIFEVLQTKCRLYAERLGRWPSLVYLPIEMHDVLQKGVLDEYGQPNKLLGWIKLFELEDVDRPAEGDYVLETVIWDGPALVGINMSSPHYCGAYWPVVNPLRREKPSGLAELLANAEQDTDTREALDAFPRQNG